MTNATPGVAMLDAAMIALLALGWAAAWGYVRFCAGLIRTAPKPPDKPA